MNLSACFAALLLSVQSPTVGEETLPIRIAEVSQTGIELIVPTAEGFAYFPLASSDLDALSDQPIEVLPLTGDGTEQRLTIPIDNAERRFARVIKRPIYFSEEREFDIIIEAFLATLSTEADGSIVVDGIRTPDGTFSFFSRDQAENLAIRFDGGLSLLVDIRDPNRLNLAMTFDSITVMDYEGNFIASHTPKSILDEGGPNIPVSVDIQIQFTGYDTATAFLTMLMASGELIEEPIEDFGQSFS